MLTRSAAATDDFARDSGVGVVARRDFTAMGCTPDAMRARLAAGRWQQLGKAIVLHNGELTREQRWAVGVINCGPQAILASFSAIEELGLRGWERDQVHVLAPAGVARPKVRGIPLVLHRTAAIDPRDVFGVRRVQCIAPALVLAASSFASARPGCGLLAAGAQQRLTTAAELRRAVLRAPRARHRRTLLQAADDIEMGAEALSEIDLLRLCRRFHLPVPKQQAVRREPGGRRRYLDAEWLLPDGRRLVVEVDGALHLIPKRWFDDQMRQNEIVLGGSLVLRYPSFIVRTEPRLVADQLRRAFAL